MGRVTFLDNSTPQETTAHSAQHTQHSMPHHTAHSIPQHTTAQHNTAHGFTHQTISHHMTTNHTASYHITDHVISHHTPNHITHIYIHITHRTSHPWTWVYECESCWHLVDEKGKAQNNVLWLVPCLRTCSWGIFKTIWNLKDFLTFIWTNISPSLMKIDWILKVLQSMEIWVITCFARIDLFKKNL